MIFQNAPRFSTVSILAVALLHLPAQAADPVGPQEHTSRSFQQWTEGNGPNWHTYADVQTGYVQFLYGGHTAAAFEPVSDEDVFQLGWLAIEATEGLHGIESATLVEDRVVFLPLSLVGSTDKVTARFRQEVGGVPVLGGYVNTLFTTEGNLLAVQTTAMPDLLGFSTDAQLDGKRAEEIALSTFEKTVGLPGGLTGGATLTVGQLETSLTSREARLVWVVDVQWQEPGMEPEGNTYWIDARNGAVIRTRPNIHNFDVGGTLSSMATPGTLPDQSNNPPASLPMNHARIDGGSHGTVTTDANGNFNFPGVTGPINLTLEYYGPWADVDNSAGGEYTLSTPANGTGNGILMNPTGTAQITAQANAFIGIGDLRDYVRGVNPSDGMADFRALANVNINSTCNAYYDGSSVNFFTAGGGCPNTSYTTVITHEMGHWLNVLYGTGNGSDGMGEGNADIWAMYHWDTSELGEDFFGIGTAGLRTGWNTLQFCGDLNPGCHGGSVHTEGQVWMGAAWKIRDNLNQTLGNAAGDAVADALFNGWMNAYDQTEIKSVIEAQWLTLDDIDGNIDNGTPNYPDINDGFLAQGFPGYQLSLFDFQSVTQLPDTTDELGPYTVEATIASMIGLSITGADLYYRVNGGAFSVVTRIPAGGNDWSADIPGQLSAAKVEYYLRATDSGSNTDTSPKDAPEFLYDFGVGANVQLFFDDFESGNTGWTHGTYSGLDDWELGSPNGMAGDPTSAASGNNVWGNDLGNGTDGQYGPFVGNWLRSPVINCSLAVGTTLRYQRWLTVEKFFDHAKILVNGTVVWESGNQVDHIDTSWVDHELDISAIADGNPVVQVQFFLQSNSSGFFGGWNVDDVEVTYLGEIGGCVSPVKYGTNKLNSLGVVAQISSSGTPSETSGDFAIAITLGIPDQPALLFSGPTAASAPFGGGVKLVGNPVVREMFFYLDSWGGLFLPFAVPPGSSGTTRFFQIWYRDPAHPDGTGIGLSDGLKVLFCD